MKNKRLLLMIMMSSVVLFMGACGSNNNEEEAESGNVTETEEGNDNVVVTLINHEEDNIGSAVLEEGDEGVTIRLDATHLPPGTHGFHIHETGTCEAPDFDSAGEHFNPSDAEHGFDSANGPHAGDLPNIEVAEDGTVQDEIVAEDVTLEKGQDNSLLDDDGAALIIHSDEDDYISQPAGDAGEKIVCGVIEE